jgi:hypothetical protein
MLNKTHYSTKLVIQMMARKRYIKRVPSGEKHAARRGAPFQYLYKLKNVRF